MLTVVLLAGCAALIGAWAADIGPARELAARFLAADKPAATADDGASAEREEAEGGEGLPAAGDEPEVHSQGSSSGLPDVPDIGGWMRLSWVRASDGAPAALEDGAAYRIDLPPGGMFSYRLWRESDGKAGIRNDDIIASLIVESALRAGLEAGERHIHDALPAGVKAGFDADVSDGRDLTLRNPHAFPVALLVAASGGVPAAEWKGDAPADWRAPAVTVSEPETFRPERIQLISLDRTRTGDSSGKPGMLVKVYVDGRLEHKDFYAPVPARSVRAPTEEEVGAFRHDGSLDGG